MNKIGGAVHRVQLLQMPADKLLHCKVHFHAYIKESLEIAALFHFLGKFFKKGNHEPDDQRNVHQQHPVGKRLFHAEPEALPGYDVGSGQSQNEGHNQCTHRVNQTVFQRRATNSSVKCSPVI